MLLLLLATLVPWASAATCQDGCVIASSLMMDGNCDCSQCEDEVSWNCDTCADGCPTVCGNSAVCEGSTEFTCDDGCEVSLSYVDDAWCDCSECEDESDWTCLSCGGCSTTCGLSVECSWQSTEAPVTTEPQTTATFNCDDGCAIEESYLGDDWCDCSNCEDEPNWTCSSCPGCPATCGLYVACGGPTTTVAPFVCDDNCTVAVTKLNDGFCDCGVCEDEDDFTCESCGGCPPECGDPGVDCSATTEAPETTEGPFICDDGCEIDASYAEDDYCDCSECEDESAWTCASCGGCPTECGSYEECSLQTTTMAPFETSTSTTTEEPTEAEDGAATVRLLLAAVLGLLSAMAL